MGREESFWRLSSLVVKFVSAAWQQQLAKTKPAHQRVRLCISPEERSTRVGELQSACILHRTAKAVVTLAPINSCSTIWSGWACPLRWSAVSLLQLRTPCAG